MQYGRFYEEFSVGDVYKHWPGRTITDTDNTWFSLLSQNQHPIHIDNNYASKVSEKGECLINGILVLAIAVGQSVADISGKAIANLGYDSIEHLAPTYSGDTIYSESKILHKSLTSKGDSGIIFSEIKVINQKNEIVMTLKRKTLVPLKKNRNYGVDFYGENN